MLTSICVCVVIRNGNHAIHDVFPNWCSSWYKTPTCNLWHAGLIYMVKATSDTFPVWCSSWRKSETSETQLTNLFAGLSVPWWKTPNAIRHMFPKLFHRDGWATLIISSWNAWLILSWYMYEHMIGQHQLIMAKLWYAILRKTRLALQHIENTWYMKLFWKFAIYQNNSFMYLPNRAYHMFAMIDWCCPILLWLIDWLIEQIYHDKINNSFHGFMINMVYPSRWKQIREHVANCIWCFSSWYR